MNLIRFEIKIEPDGLRAKITHSYAYIQSRSDGYWHRAAYSTAEEFVVVTFGWRAGTGLVTLYHAFIWYWWITWTGKRGQPVSGGFQVPRLSVGCDERAHVYATSDNEVCDS
jgi:hypothetical protein